MPPKAYRSYHPYERGYGGRRNVDPDVNGATDGPAGLGLDQRIHEITLRIQRLRWLASNRNDVTGWDSLQNLTLMIEADLKQLMALVKTSRQ